MKQQRISPHEQKRKQLIDRAFGWFNDVFAVASFTSEH